LACQQQTTPGGGARQLSKLKRFLTTLIQFGLDISVDIGERVRSLVLALVVRTSLYTLSIIIVIIIVITVVNTTCVESISNTDQ
jgi:hypothetical protein